MISRFGPYFVEPIIAGLEDKGDQKNGQLLCHMCLGSCIMYHGSCVSVSLSVVVIVVVSFGVVAIVYCLVMFLFMWCCMYIYIYICIVPFIFATDLIGAGLSTTDYVVGGTASEELYGTCEAMYRPNLVTTYHI